MSDPDAAAPSSHSERALDWANFFIADVQTAFGPFVAVYLGLQGWEPGAIGLVLTVGGLAAIASQVPGGVLVDALASKRLLIGCALAAIGVGALIFATLTSPVMIYSAEILHGCASGVITPALAAIGLGLVGHRALPHRLGRNSRFGGIGNAATAALMGLLGSVVAPQATFWIAVLLCVPAIFAVSRIRRDEIDYARARSARDRAKPREVARFRELGKNKHLLLFIGSLVLFQFANAAIMPLASSQLGRSHQGMSIFVTSALVVVPQLTMAALAGLVARHVDKRGRKPLLLIGFAALPLRAGLFALAPGVGYLIGVQLLGGVTAAVIGIMTPLVIADLARGTGRFNFAQGAAGTATGIGAALSTVAGGYAAQLWGYDVAFLGFAVVGLAAVLLVFVVIPETAPEHVRRPKPSRKSNAVARATSGSKPAR